MKIKKADLGVALYILAAFVMFIISIPSWLLDIFLAINIGIAFLILFTVMFTKEVLDMSFYPTMLLFTTIFRIALNVSSTKLILLTGNPGNVVTTFGNYVGGGDLVVGVIIFIILILITTNWITLNMQLGLRESVHSRGYKYGNKATQYT